PPDKNNIYYYVYTPPRRLKPLDHIIHLVMAILNKTRTTVVLLVLWFVFILLVAYILPNLGNTKTGTHENSAVHPRPVVKTPASDSKESTTAKVIDEDNDGIPDSAELTTFADRESFRRWIT